MGHSPGDEKLFFGTNQQVELTQRALQLFGDLRIGDEAVGTFTARGQSPQHGAIVDIEHAQNAMLFGVGKCHHRGCAYAGRTQMRSSDQQRATLRNESLVNLRCVQRHIGAVLTVEQQWEGIAVFETEQHQSGQAMRVRLNL